MRNAIIASLFLFVTSPAYAYDSLACGSGSADCEGVRAARSPWVVSEHAEIWLRTRRVAGLPAEIDAPFGVRTPLSGAIVENIFNSFEATPLDVAIDMQDRVIELAVFAQLPDKSYALWDWASGNEGCPPTGTGGFEECHAFESHMGWLNSNHFAPQSGQAFARYHALAVQRARDCADMKRALDLAGLEDLPILQACDREALLLEAIGHHFLQDAWSMGHTWMRWGSTEMSDFPVTGDGEVKDYGDAIGRASGIIHGAKAITHFADAMCAPDEGIEMVHEGMTFAGAGDLFLDRVNTDAGLATQRERMYDCTATAMREVYLASAQSFGPAGASMQRTVPLETCFSARATNRSMALGAAIQVPIAVTSAALTAAPVFIELTGLFGPVTVALLVHLPFVSDAYLSAMNLPRAQEDFYLPLTSDLLTRLNGLAFNQVISGRVIDQWHNDMARIQAILVHYAVLSPDTTELAGGAMGPLLGMHPNYAYDGGTTSYLDPPLPWTPTKLDLPAAATIDKAPDFLARTFSLAHTRDWCEVMTETGDDEFSLQNLRSRCRDPDLDPTVHDAACSICTERVRAHLRQVDPRGAVVVKESLCNALGVSNAVAIEIGPTSSSSIAEEWCEDGCVAGESLDLPLIGKMNCVPAGSFLQGCVPGRDDIFEACQAGTTPPRFVTISDPFWMMEREMNADVMVQGGVSEADDNCAGIPLATCPAVNVRWDVATTVADALSQAAGLELCGMGADLGCRGFRLPSEAEFEYAARGGEDFVYPGSNNANDVWSVDWQASCSKARNAFGLCDMASNAREWTLDGYNVNVVVGAGAPDELPPGIPSYPAGPLVDPVVSGPGHTIDGADIYGAKGGNPVFAQRCADRDWAIMQLEHVAPGGNSVTSALMGFRLVVNAR